MSSSRLTDNQEASLKMAEAAIKQYKKDPEKWQESLASMSDQDFYTLQRGLALGGDLASANHQLGLVDITAKMTAHVHAEQRERDPSSRLQHAPTPPQSTPSRSRIDTAAFSPSPPDKIAPTVGAPRPR